MIVIFSDLASLSYSHNLHVFVLPSCKVHFYCVLTTACFRLFGTGLLANHVKVFSRK